MIKRGFKYEFEGSLNNWIVYFDFYVRYQFCLCEVGIEELLIL